MKRTFIEWLKIVSMNGYGYSGFETKYNHQTNHLQLKVINQQSKQQLWK